MRLPYSGVAGLWLAVVCACLLRPGGAGSGAEAAAHVVPPARVTNASLLESDLVLRSSRRGTCRLAVAIFSVVFSRTVGLELLAADLRTAHGEAHVTRRRHSAAGLARLICGDSVYESFPPDAPQLPGAAERLPAHLIPLHSDVSDFDGRMLSDLLPES